MKDHELIGYGITATCAALFLYYTWQYLVAALALYGLWYLVNNNNRRPPRCR